MDRTIRKGQRCSTFFCFLHVPFLLFHSLSLILHSGHFLFEYGESKFYKCYISYYGWLGCIKSFYLCCCLYGHCLSPLVFLLCPLWEQGYVAASIFYVPHFIHRHVHILLYSLIFFFPFVRGVLSKHIYIHSTRGMIEGAMIFMHSCLFCSCRYDLRREHSTCTFSRPF